MAATNQGYGQVSIFDSIGVVSPSLEWLQSRRQPKLREDDRPLWTRLREQLEESTVVEPGVGSIPAISGIDNRTEARPQGCGCAHGTRLTGSYEDASRQSEVVDPPAGSSNRNDFGVRGRVVAGDHVIRSQTQDDAFPCDYRPERPAPRGNVLRGQADGLLEPSDFPGGRRDSQVAHCHRLAMRPLRPGSSCPHACPHGHETAAEHAERAFHDGRRTPGGRSADRTTNGAAPTGSCHSTSTACCSRATTSGSTSIGNTEPSVTRAAGGRVVRVAW